MKKAMRRLRHGPMVVFSNNLFLIVSSLLLVSCFLSVSIFVIAIIT